MTQRQSRSDIERRVIDIVATALDREPASVGLHDSLIDDLDAESIDFLDLQFRIESEFGMRFPEEEIWQGRLDLTDERWAREGRLTAEGRAQLERLQPDFPWERFPDEIPTRDFPRLITVDTLVDYLEQRLSEAED
jgi:acyl carrier protein